MRLPGVKSPRVSEGPSQSQDPTSCKSECQVSDLVASPLDRQARV